MDVGDIETCYIKDCSTGDFMWGSDIEAHVDMEKEKAHWMIIPISLVIGCCVCCAIMAAYNSWRETNENGTSEYTMTRRNEC